MFPHIDHNEGGGYDASTGVFTAPCAGTYIFLAAIQGYGRQAGDDTAFVALMQDSLERQWVLTEADRKDRKDDFDSTSLQAVLRLAAGSQVWLMTYGDQIRLYGDYYTTFSGILVTPDF